MNDNSGPKTNSRITTLFLDLGGVLLTNGWDEATRKRAAETFALDFPEMNHRHHLTYDTLEAGKLSLDEYLKRVVFYRPRSFSTEAFKNFMIAQSQPFPQMMTFIRALKARHRLKIAVISNECRELSDYRTATFKLSEFVDFFIVSCFVHFRKPDEDIYRVALSAAQVPPAQAAYVDDRAMFVEVAQGLGLRGIHHTDYESTRVELDKLGLSLP